MKIVIPRVIFISLIFSTQVFADCTASRNANIAITKPNSIYTDHGDGTVTDSKTKLMWQKCTLGLSGNSCATGTAEEHTWQGALAAAKAANSNTSYGYSDWRLPNKNELESLVDIACFSPPINQVYFPATQSQQYWTSSVNVNIAAYAWFVDFKLGTISSNTKNTKTNYFVRLVRGG